MTTPPGPARKTGIRAIRVAAADVARAAGVSTATVSYVLNGRAGVSAEMRQHVLQVAEELGYPLEQHGARVKAQRTRVLGLIHPDMSNPFYSDVSAGAIDAARAEGYEVFLAHTQENSETLANITRAMIARSVDGIIFTVLHPDDGERIRELRRASIPFIQMSRRIPTLRADYVGVDDVAGADEILRHVVAHGYDDIAVVTGVRNSSASATRAASFVATANDIGLPLPANRQFSAYLSEEGGRRLILRLIAEDDVPRAIVCGSDAIASGIIGGLRANGYRVPEDVAVTGYDGVFPLASMLAELTTVSLPRRHMAKVAVQQVVRRIEGVGGPVRDFIHPYRIRIGTSCGCNADVTVLPPRPVLTAGRTAKRTVGRKMTDRILVVGAGAIGGVTAAHLTRAGHDVTTLDANVEHSALLVSPGLILEERSGNTSTTPIRAVTDVSQLDGPFDFALITVKSLAIRAAITPLVDRDLVDTYVSLGNGLVQDVVESIVGRDRLVVGLVEWGATNVGPGHLRQTTEAPMVVGELSGELTERLQRLQTVLSSVTAQSKVSSAIGGHVWSKLLLNSTFSGLGAAGGCLYREIVADPTGREVALRLWTEGYDIAIALGMELSEVFGTLPTELVVRGKGPWPDTEKALDRLMTRAGATKASMLQDLEHARKTEVDVINGGIVEAAERIGRKAPLNAELTRIIHEYENGLTQPTKESFGRLMEVYHNDNNP